MMVRGIDHSRPQPVPNNGHLIRSGNQLAGSADESRTLVMRQATGTNVNDMNVTAQHCGRAGGTAEFKGIRLSCVFR